MLISKVKNIANNLFNKKMSSAFTVSRLLVFIVFIGVVVVLVALSIGNNNDQSDVLSLKSDLLESSQTLKNYSDKYGSYPTGLDKNNCPNSPTADISFCLQSSNGTRLNYQIESKTSDYALYATKGSIIYKITPSAPPFATGLASVCPDGFIVVPGSATYGVISSFCVMKYEAKCALIEAPKVGLTTPNSGYGSYDNNVTACTLAGGKGVVSTSSGYALTDISQLSAISYSASTYGCSGCQIMSDAQWMTLAQNVLSNLANWSGGAVGIGYIYSGHNDTLPASALVSGKDNNGYFGTGDTSGNQKRTLTLTNGEIIWDMSGNVREWTGAQQAGGLPTGTPLEWREWPAVSGGRITPNPYPATTGLSGAYEWNSANGIGMIYSDSEDIKPKGFIRGGDWAGGIHAGVLELSLNTTPTFRGVALGFRVAR